MPVSISGTNGVTFPDNSLQTAAASPYVLKNRIINGDMRIDQRNAGASVTPDDGIYSLDRWRCFQSPNSKYSVQQNAASVTRPTGFTNYLGTTIVSAYTPTGTNYAFISQAIEGLNCADLAWGTANAQTVTLSFWVRSSLTGNFGAIIYNNGYTRTYPILYTINSANTWEYKTITIPGDTSGTWLTTNGLGIGVGFCLGAGSTVSAASGSWTSTSNIYGVTGQTQVVGTNGATFYITGVQLEIGSTATPFERRMYGQELANCQRYFTLSSSSAGVCQISTQAYLWEYLKVSMRTAPSVTFPASLTSVLQAMGVGARTPTSCSAEAYTNDYIAFTAGGYSGTSLTTGNPMRWNGTAIQVSAEL